MKTLCSNCNIKKRIEEYKEKLDDSIERRCENLLDDEVVILSQFLDNFVYKCVSCNKNIQHLSKLNLKNVFGTHTTFYYYGEQHLLINLYFYINEGIKNNELIYVSMEEELYNKLLDFLKVNKVPTENVKFRAVKELISGHKKGGFNGLVETATNILGNIGIEKYNGLRWIGQPSFAIEGTSQKDFLDMEADLNKFIKNMNAALLCVYDAHDYINKGKVINEKVIKESLQTHSFILNNYVS
ncbi:MEDS domain-containing protein [Clostridium botulinum]|uniref:MEDS domain-containing protein n=1 Tax=Clostridium botulinum TaxID=1491 RepID=UPI00077326FA|nr:MEDS domain-containing protein [Clostridium botulinum]MBY6931456.1 MEDS domain-containing protein [Clostridium botulinum]NFG21878.1 Spo0E family sporulation regulatory protein-aspartic acid phosphatase [Clostridium botulinum]NFO80561.1 Spo0E family sporulation regulatory protein-aspartic acid phosphatase [Clostridium botulinum]HBJ2623289.1 MEDS domain-containing protein [Clostridium botulinum]